MTFDEEADAEEMKPADFHIGLEFFVSGVSWRCTDVGTRTIAAIKLDGRDAYWFDGPPYALVEHILEENDLEVCSLEDD